MLNKEMKIADNLRLCPSPMTAAEVSATPPLSSRAKPNFLPRCSETQPRVRFSVGENRMKLANTTNLNRKFGKPRDLQFSEPFVEMFFERAQWSECCFSSGSRCRLRSSAWQIAEEVFSSRRRA